MSNGGVRNRNGRSRSNVEMLHSELERHSELEQHSELVQHSGLERRRSVEKQLEK